MPKTVDNLPSFSYQKIAEELAAQVPDSVVASFLDAMRHRSQRAPRVTQLVIEPRSHQEVQPDDGVVDHHERFMPDVIQGNHGVVCAAGIALRLILDGVLPRRVMAEIRTSTTDTDQWLAAQVIQAWADTGQIPIVLQEMAHVAKLLEEEFWLLEKHKLIALLNELPPIDPEFSERPARITRYVKPGELPIMHIEIHTSKSSFNNNGRYQAYIRRLAIEAGFTTDTGLVLVQNYFGRTGKALKKTDVHLGIMGCYDSVLSLANVAAPLSDLFHKVTMLFAHHGFDSIHPSSRNMLTLVVPTESAAQKYISRTNIDVPSPMQAAVKYHSLASVVGLIANELGYEALPAIHVGTPEVLIANQ